MRQGASSALILLLCAVICGCGKPNAGSVETAPVSTSINFYPANPEQAGWNAPQPAFTLPVEQLIPEINRLQEQDDASAFDSDSDGTPIEELQSTESLAPNIYSEERTALDRAQDREEAEMLTAPGELTMDDAFMGGGPKKKKPTRRAPQKRPGKKKPAPKPKGPPKPQTWETILPPDVTRGITYGTSIAGPQPYTRKDAELFIPASISKTVSVSRALEILGPDFRFKTTFVWADKGGGIADQFTITADGDPTFGSSDFKDGGFTRAKKIVQEIKEQGITEIRGGLNLVSADSRWEHVAHPAGVEKQDYLACYGALASAFNVASNCAVLTITSANSAKWNDSGIKAPITLNLTVGAKTAISFKPVLEADGHLIGYEVNGTWAKSRRAAAAARVPVPNPKEWMKNIFIREFTAAGIKYNPDIPSQAGGAGHIITVASSPLSQIIVPLLKQSDNYLADTLFKRAGMMWPNRSISLREASQLQIAEGVRQWTAAAGFPHMKDEFLLLDGAGLSRNNRATPRVYLALLKMFSQQSFFSSLWKGLPIAGIDGTLAGRLKGAKTRGIVRGKTGTVRGAYQLIGFMPDYNTDASVKEYVPFVILTSAAPGSSRRIYTIQERLLNRLGSIVNPSFSPPRIPMP